MSLRPLVVAIGILATVAACTRSERPPGDVDTARIVAADDEPGNWLTHGRTYGEQRYSPLRAIDTESVKRLGLAWSYDLAMNRGAEATPLVVDGVMYVTSAWSIVHAIDARSGARLWVHDPKVDRAVGAKACCDVVNRGVAVYGGKVFVGVIDGRLVALDAATGSVAWETVTVDQSQAYTITGAPRVANGLVYIGNGGAEYGVRGYVSAYDANTGSLKWRFYTVPGDPAKGPDGAASDPVMARAAKTWTGEWWAGGGGGTAWDAIVYDPEFDQLLVGVGNGSPWNQQIRSPGGGDNLFLASIVALDAKTGAYRWHYQTTPGETWDYTATQPIMLADLTIDGRPRKVVMQAPKNGFFYVIDRTDGRLISASPFLEMLPAKDTPKGAPLAWAYAVDRATGRPIENPEARYKSGADPHASEPRWRAQLAPDVLQPADRARVPPHAGLGAGLRARSGVHAARGVQQYRGAPRGVPGRSAGAEGHPEQRQGGAAGLGPRDAERGLEGGASWSLEWGHAGRGGRPGVPGHGRRALPRARRKDGRGAVVVRQPGRHARRAHQLRGGRRTVRRGAGRLRHVILPHQRLLRAEGGRDRERAGLRVQARGRGTETADRLCPHPDATTAGAARDRGRVSGAARSCTRTTASPVTASPRSPAACFPTCGSRAGCTTPTYGSEPSSAPTSRRRGCPGSSDT